ncbi:unnamed protein product, partial [Sphagnum tenellum]
YPDDIVDRYWLPMNSSSVESTAQVEALTATGIMNATGIVNARFPPEAVMNTALTTNGTMTIDFPYNQAYIFLMRVYMAELNPNATASSREFYVKVPGYRRTWTVNPLLDVGGLGGLEEIYFRGGVANYLSLFQNQSISTALGPLVNALEIFERSGNQFAILTNEQDTLAIEEIKSSYGNLGVWTGDPCLPYPHPWVTCSNISILQNSSSIIAVNLSGYNLTGPISPNFGKLRSLTSLNLSTNQLNGSIPPSIWDIPKLNVLDLSNNNLSGNLVPITSTLCPTSLKILTLNDNHLTGSIPLSIWEISTLTILDLSNNNISGNLIPMNTVNIPCPRSLTNLNFDYNKFIGTMDMSSFDDNYLLNGTFLISMVNNSISILKPTWEDVPSNFPTSTHNVKIIWILCTTLSFSILLGGIICGVIYWKYHKNALALCEIQKEFAKQQVQPTLYSYNVLSKATRDFHQDNKLGEGGFGVVYKGILLDGTKLAIKLLTTKSHQGIDDFLNEVVSITGVRHKNLVKLKGCCLHHTQRLLVYEYVENKNLAEALWDSNMEDNIFLDWPTRFHIFVGIARGLVYLHEELQPCIIHRDIKASNILLNNNLSAKIADFGLARLFSDDQSQLFTQVAGTIGYMSPEYATLGQLSTKVDVYSFGVLLLEIISGRKAILQNATSNMYLVEWAWSLHKTNMLISLVDQKIHNTIVESEMRRAINVALLCVQVETTKRPIMSQVLIMLQGEMDLPNILASPSQTNILNLSLDVSTSESNHLLSFPIPNNYSNAEVELTNLDAR